MKKLFTVLAAVLGMIACILPSSAVSAEGAILIEAETGAVLFEKNAEQKLPMASTTKIMTAVVVLENTSLEKVVTVSKSAAETEGSSMYLKSGERITVRELLYGLMLASGNDAANALAEFVGGTRENFVRLMNEKAKALGMKNTSFETPSGLDGAAHYSTAHDMAVLAAYALKNDVFAEIVSTKAVTLGERHLVNHNRLIFSYRYAIGVKTGYTVAAGRCLVSAARKDGVTLVAVTLSDRDDWNDHIAMYEEAFQKVRRTLYCSTGDIYKVPVVGAAVSFAAASPAEDLYTVSVNEAERAVTKVEIPRFVYAPLKKGDVVGKVIVKTASGITLETNIVITDAIENLPRKGFFDWLLRWFEK